MSDFRSNRLLLDHGQSFRSQRTRDVWQFSAGLHWKRQNASSMHGKRRAISGNLFANNLRIADGLPVIGPPLLLPKSSGVRKRSNIAAYAIPYTRTTCST